MPLPPGMTDKGRLGFGVWGAVDWNAGEVGDGESGGRDETARD